jgi:hypothetical protein
MYSKKPAPKEWYSMTRYRNLTLCLFAACALTQPIVSQTPVNRRVVIAASVVLDGNGRVLRDTRIAIEGQRLSQ